ncbi:MAG: adenylate/guanylate cyclase domain-containing protein [Elusimicrobiota bacterium]
MKKGKLTTLLISLSVGFLVIVLWIFGLIRGLENKFLDSMFTLRGPIKPAEEIVIIAFDEESFKQLGRWPWTRVHYAKVVDMLTQAGAKSIVFDVIFPEPESEHPGADETFARAAKNSGKVVLASHFSYDIEGNPSNFIMPVPVLQQEAYMGFANIMAELDGVCRKIPLFKVYKDKVVPSLATAGLAVYYNQPPEKLIADKKVILDEYNEMLVNFSGGYETFQYSTFSYVLNGIIPASNFKDKIVILGGTASGLFDFKAIPYSPMFPGVEIHANTMSNIILGNFLRPMPSLMTLLLIIVFVLFSGLVSGRLAPFRGGIVTMGLLAGFFVVVFVLFKSRYIYAEFVAPASGLTLSYVGVLFYRFMTEEREKRKIKKTFSQYLSPKIMEKVLNDPSYLKMGGHKETLTVLFSDIRGFTTITESLPPEELVAQLNEYLSKMVDVVFKWDGTMDKFIGDAVMAYWGAPIPQNDHPIRGVMCAIDMHKELKILQDKWNSEGKQFVFNIGVGVNTGEMIVGNMGSTGKKDFTVIGDNVNLGARLESTTKEYHAKLIISEATYDIVKESIDAKHIGSVKVKGKTKPVEIYAVLGKKGEEPISIADQIHKDEIKKEEAPKPAASAAPAAPEKFDPDARTQFPKK